MFLSVVAPITLYQVFIFKYLSFTKGQRNLGQTARTKKREEQTRNEGNDGRGMIPITCT